MATSPSQKWKDGRLVERALDSRGEPEENTAEAVTGSPTKQAQPNSTFSSRRAARIPVKDDEVAKAVEGKQAENKAVGSSERKRRR